MLIAIVHTQSMVRVVSELAGPLNVFIPPAACVFVDVVVPTACLIGLVRLEFEQSSVHIKL
jgi:predicted membrane protein